MRCGNGLTGLFCCSLLVGCYLPDTSSGTKPAVNEPPEITLLAAEDQEYVRSHIFLFYQGDVDGAYVDEGFAELGPEWDDAYPIYRAGMAVHMANHNEYKDVGCNHANERRASRRAAQAMRNINRPVEAGIWDSHDGMHCTETE